MDNLNIICFFFFFSVCTNQCHAIHSNIYRVTIASKLHIIEEIYQMRYKT